MTDPTIADQTIASIAALARLELSAERRAALAAQLAGWIAAANQLSATIARRHGHPSPVAPMLRFPGP